jgi:hypothetical protein
MGMEDILPRNGSGGHPKTLPFEMRFGEAQNSTLCQSCKVHRKAGFYVIWKDIAVLVCIQCTATAMMKYQDMYLKQEKIFQVDAEVPPEVMANIIAEVVSENKDVPENIVAKIARSAIEKI